MTNDRMSDEELVAYYEAKHKQGKDFEGLVPVEARVAKDFSSVFSVRFKGKELARVEAAARARGTTIGALIREAALREAARETPDEDGPKVDLTRAEQETLFQALRQVIATRPETKPARRSRRSNTAAERAESR